jgi:hypothetical protein
MPVYFKMPAIAATHRGPAPRKLSFRSSLKEVSLRSAACLHHSMGIMGSAPVLWLFGRHRIGNARWITSIKFSSVWIAGTNSCSPPGSSFSFTTNSSATIRSGANCARQNGPLAERLYARKPAQLVRSADVKPQFRSSRHKDAQCFAGNVSSASVLCRQHNLSPELLCNASYRSIGRMRFSARSNSFAG